MKSGVFTILIYAQTTVNTRHIFIDISVTMGQRKVITIYSYMNSYRLTLYISSVVYMLASRGPILKLYLPLFCQSLGSLRTHLFGRLYCKECVGKVILR